MNEAATIAKLREKLTSLSAADKAATTFEYRMDKIECREC